MDKYSYIYGRGEEAIRYTTIPALLDLRAKELGDKPVHVFRFREKAPTDGSQTVINRIVITFSKLASESLHLAAALLDIGVKPKENIIIAGSNCPEYVFVDYACLRISVFMIRFPLNVGTFEALLTAIKKHQVHTLILDDYDLVTKLETTYPGLFNRNENIYGVSVENVIILKKSPTPGTQNWISVEELLKFDKNIDQVIELQEEQNPDDPALIFPTSGSTGEPKHVIFSHFSVINGVTLILSKLFSSLDEDFILMNDRSFSWIGGIPHTAVFFGITSILMKSTIFTSHSQVAETFCQIAAEEMVTDAIVLNYLLYDLKKHHENKTLSIPSKLRSIASGGELMSNDILEFGLNVFGRVGMLYGCTEAMFPCFSVQTTTSRSDMPSLTWFNTLSGYEIKIVNDDDKVIQRNQIGNIKIRNPFILLKYLDEDKLTKTIKTSSGWISTGDLGAMNSDGLLKIVGRTKDVISKGTIKVYPTMVEKTLINHPNVASVAVVGVPDPKLFNDICAFIIPKEGFKIDAAQIEEYIDSQLLNDATIIKPRYYIFIESFPRGRSGKLDKMKLREIAIKELRL